MLLTLLFAVISIKGVMGAARQTDVYQRAAGVGLYSLFGLQAVINMSVNLSLIPPKGMTLPLVSSGGSSLLGTALTLGLALALTRKQPETSLSHLRHGMSDADAKPLVVIAAGGTGGHMFPAQAFADEMRARGWTIALVTDERGKKYAARISRPTGGWRSRRRRSDRSCRTSCSARR